MYNSTEYYQAELDYRRAQVRLDRRPLWIRRRTRAARNQVVDGGAGTAA